MNNNDYLASNNIQDLFEALTDSLLLNQPFDVIQHIQDALENVKFNGLEVFKYENFHSTKTNIKDNNCLRGLFKYKAATEKSPCQGDTVVDFRVILLMSAPGEVNDIGGKLCDIFVNFGFIDMGKCLRNRIQKESQKGVSRWKVSKSLIHNGDFVPEDVALNVLLDEMAILRHKELIIIEGYPKNVKQITDFENAIGINRIVKVFFIDSFENDCRTALLNCYSFRSPDSEFDPYESSRKLANYKAYTLPVLKYFQDCNKLVILENELLSIDLFKKIIDILMIDNPGIINKFKYNVTQLEEISNKIEITKQRIRDNQIQFQFSQSPSIMHAEQLYLMKLPKNRTYNISKVPVIVIQGAPKSGKSTIARIMCKNLVGWYHCDFSLIKPFSIIGFSLKEIKVHCCELHRQLEIISSFATGIILENYPNSHMELDIFNQEIGKIDFQIFIDVSDFNISLRYLRCQNIKPQEDGIDLNEDCATMVKSILDYYKNTIMPVVRYYSDNGVSFNVFGDQEYENIATQCIDVVKSIFY